MASYVVQDTQLTAIASAIRTKSGTSEGMTVAEMPSKINEIKGSADPILQDKSATPNESQQNITPDNGYDGLSSVSVSPIPSEYIVREEISEQDALISNIMTALEGKAGGGSSGGSVETCTVTVNSFAANISQVWYSSYENGEYKFNKVVPSSLQQTMTVNNVLVGAWVKIASSYDFCGFEISGNSPDDYTIVQSSWSYIDIVPFNDITITIIDDD